MNILKQNINAKKAVLKKVKNAIGAHELN